MPSALIIGPDYFNFLNASKNAFRQKGFSVSVCGYDVPVHPYDTAMKLRWKFSGSSTRERLLAAGRGKFSAGVRAAFDESGADVVFILNGDQLTPGTVDYFRSRGAKVALWLFDSRSKLPQADLLAPRVDALFCFDPKDAAQYMAEGLQAHFLPQACDTSVYHPLGEGGLEKDIDILFVGDIFRSRRRRDTLMKVVEAFPDRRIEIYGLFQPWYKGFLKWLCRPHKTIFKNRNIDPEQVNLLYNRARIVLNIHQESQLDGANPRVFEICGSGAYQICDRNDYLSGLFGNGEVGMYGSADELIGLIAEKLSCDNSAAALQARRLVESEHTFTERIGTVLKVLE